MRGFFAALENDEREGTQGPGGLRRLSKAASALRVFSQGSHDAQRTRAVSESGTSALCGERAVAAAKQEQTRRTGA